MDLKKLIKELKSKVDERGYLDVGKGMEKEFGVSKERFRTALGKIIQEDNNYKIYFIKMKKKPLTILKILTKV